MHPIGAKVIEILVCTGKNVNQRHIARATDALSKGDIVVLPTETGYCFAGRSDHKATHSALLKLRQAHPRHKPFSLLCENAKQIGQISQVSTAAYRVINKVLPGPFTLILPVHRNTPQTSTGEFRTTVGVRISSHPIAQAVCAAVQVPLMVTSVTDGEELIAEGYTESDFEEQLERWWTNAEGISRHSHGLVKIFLAGEEPLPLHVSTILDLSTEGEVRVLRDGGWELSIA
jgi:tRNA threonylcarbamoyl adenosine modification protein (Sua5/YciO/YrdC/YwlC family)